MTPVWVAELAARFWAAAGPPPAFPRDLRSPVVRGVGSVVSIRGLSVAAVTDWLGRSGMPAPDLGADRPLRGALYAAAGVGFFFAEADDDPAELRFTVAHELAHFLRDYLQVRERAVAAVGPGLRDVLDGRRRPTHAETVVAVVRGVPAGPFTHLMARTADGCDAATAMAERNADRLAAELLAPADEVLARAGRPDAVGVLTDEFGLPPAVARWYAGELFPAPPTDPVADRVAKLLRPASDFPGRHGTSLPEGRDG